MITVLLLGSCGRIGYGPDEEPADAPLDFDGEEEVVFQLEAESALLTAPFRELMDSRTSGGVYVIDATNGGGFDPEGSALLVFEIEGTQTRNYYVAARVLALDTARDSFRLVLDGGEDNAFHTGPCTHSEYWQWVFVNLSPACPEHTRPRTYALGPGMHSLVLLGREGQSAIDRFALVLAP